MPRSDLDHPRLQVLGRLFYYIRHRARHNVCLYYMNLHECGVRSTLNIHSNGRKTWKHSCSQHGLALDQCCELLFVGIATGLQSSLDDGAQDWSERPTILLLDNGLR